MSTTTEPPLAATHDQPRTSPQSTAEQQRSEAAMLPEPGHVTASPAGGDADDLISRMAEAQIDEMLGDADFAPPDAPPTEPAPITDSVASSTDPETAMTDPAPDSHAVDPLADLERSAHAASAVEAALDAAVVVDPPVVPSAEALDHELSSANAVAAELAADAHLHGRSEAIPEPTHAEPATEVAHSADHAHAAAIPEVPPSPAGEPHVTWLSRLLAIPMAILDAINFPVRGLSDAAREALGTVAIVTIANAAGLIAYRMLFASH